MTARIAFVPLALLVAGCASLPHPWPREPVCSATLPAGASLDPQTWFTLLLHGYDPHTHRATTPALDCTGTQIRWDAPALLCTDMGAAGAALTDRPLADGDVTVTRVDPVHMLVWARTSRYASGDALGPVALVEQKGSTLSVEAVGSLRANPERAQLRLVKAGTSLVLVAEGERCTGRECERSARLMPLVGRRFSPARITSDQGSCLGAAWVHLQYQERERPTPGRERRYRVDASLKPGPAGLELVELVTVVDRDPREATAPDRLFRRAEGTTVLRVQGGELVADAPTLWTRVLAARE